MTSYLKEISERHKRCGASLPVVLAIIYLYSILLLVVLTQSCAEILRLDCAIYANFRVKKQNETLQHTFLTIPGADTVQCRLECIMNKQCKTFNINEDEMVCELNDKSTEDVRDNAKTVVATGWTYYSTQYNESNVCRKTFKNCNINC